MIIYKELIIIFLATMLLGWLSRRLGMPIVVGQLVAGVLIGPSVLRWASLSSSINSMAEIGVLILMFIVGVETDIKQLKSNFQPSLVVAVLGASLPMIAFVSLVHYLGYPLSVALFLGIVFSATSVSITAEVLNEYRQLNTKSGSTILGAAVADDILAVILLTTFVSVFEGNAQGVSSIGLKISMMILFFVLFIAFGYYLLPKLVDLLLRMKLPAITATVGIMLAIGSGYLAESVGVSGVVGSFFAGLFISQLTQSGDIVKQTATIGYGFFIPIFFASIGLKISFAGLGNQWLVLAIFVIFAILTKWIGAGVGAWLTGLRFRESNIVGVGMVSRGEMALIISDIGLSSHIINSGMYSNLALVILVTTLFTPIMLRWLLVKQ